MALTFIPGGAGSYSCINSDISSGSVTGARFIGAKLYVEDTGLWYIVSANGGLVPFSQQVNTGPDLVTGAKTLNLTLASGAGQAPIADTSKTLGIYITSSSAAIIGLEPVAIAAGSAAGSALSGSWTTGIQSPSGIWNFYNIGYGVSRILYIRAGASDTFKLIQM
jgi:hypothetical protein